MYLAYEKTFFLFIYFSQFKLQQDGPNDDERKIKFMLQQCTHLDQKPIVIED